MTTSSEHDFDFQRGEWRVHHQVKRPDPGGWIEFEGTADLATASITSYAGLTTKLIAVERRSHCSISFASCFLPCLVSE